jgi:hypothetical protein
VGDAGEADQAGLFLQGVARSRCMPLLVSTASPAES